MTSTINVLVRNPSASSIYDIFDKGVEDDRQRRVDLDLRYSNNYKKHYAKCHEHMLGVVEGKRGKILILVPDKLERKIFPQLIDNFPEVCLVGLSHESMNQCLETLTPEQKSKHRFTIIKGDLTEFIPVALNIILESDVVVDRMEKISKLKLQLAEMEKDDYHGDLGKQILNSFGQADVVISSLFPSQLKSFAFGFPLYVFNDLKYLKKWKEWEDMEEYGANVLQLKHLRDLRNWTKLDGDVCFIDTFKRVLSGETFLSKKFTDEMKKQFRVVSFSSHTWDMMSKEPSCLLEVQAYQLRKKSSVSEQKEGTKFKLEHKVRKQFEIDSKEKVIAKTLTILFIQTKIFKKPLNIKKEWKLLASFCAVS